MSWRAGKLAELYGIRWGMVWGRGGIRPGSDK